MDIKFSIIPYKKLKKFHISCPYISSQVLKLFNEHRSTKNFTLKQLIQEHLAYHDNVKYDANLVILLDDKTVVAMACAERNIDKSVYISSVHVNEKYRGKKLCYEVMKRLMDNYPVGTRFVLGVVNDNEPAVKCYTKLGFTVTHTKVGRKHTIDTMEFTK